jgi:uncharacterized membrane protein
MKRLFFHHALRFPGNAILAVFALLLLRMVLHHSLHFCFLVWNVFLALLPLCFARAAVRARHPGRGLTLSLAWLLLFPNAAYLVTDIVHLRILPGPLLWLDLVLLFSAGLLGVALSLQSLCTIERFYLRYMHPRWLPLLRITLLTASAYGIYLGRIGRWNSWDLVVQPLALLRDIFSDLRHPLRNREAWQLTALFAVLQIGSYYLSRSLPLQKKGGPEATLS